MTTIDYYNLGALIILMCFMEIAGMFCVAAAMKIAMFIERRIGTEKEISIKTLYLCLVLFALLWVVAMGILFPVK